MAKLKTLFKNANESTGFLLWKASNRLQKIHREGLRDFDLTPTQFSIMASIVSVCENRKALTQAELSQFTKMDKVLISDVVTTLLRKELLVKKDNLKDKRSFLLTPSKKGFRVTNKAIGAVEQMDMEFFSSITDRELFNRSLLQLLQE